ncbi:DUF6969 family protein [Acidihalobacter yilgarnensis]|uniref:DUF6969 family protein n=1 Tax=Acidihalobacter yilgarnensis TaxID=2819280 RepID=UPI000AEF1E3B|nr:hypothetical protein [Acidihalobacter yilgarnensis]
MRPESPPDGLAPTDVLPSLPEPIPPSALGFDARAREVLLAAGNEIRECYRVLERGGLNVVGEVLREQGDFVELEHYPRDDVEDIGHYSQYYYHAHRGVGEAHGHFHTFIRTGLLASPPLPEATFQVSEPWPREQAAIAHLIAIAMDDWGYPIGLFTTNRWVTGETWYAAETVAGLLPGFVIDHANPSWPTNRWITAMLRLFHPQIEALLAHRDACIGLWQRALPECDVLEDRRLEVIGYLPISVEAWMAQLQGS